MLYLFQPKGFHISNQSFIKTRNNNNYLNILNFSKPQWGSKPRLITLGNIPVYYNLNSYKIKIKII